MPKSKTLKNKVIIISGPTATGKTDLALFLAQSLKTDLISADSRQIYKSLDIGTGKDTLSLKPKKSKIKTKYGYLTYYQFPEGPRLWLTDLTTPDQSFSVADFLPLARLLIEKLQKEGKVPIFVGGTGLYLKALTQPLITNPTPPSPLLRKIFSFLPTPLLSLLLKTINLSKYNSLNSSDQKNPHRLQRALEISFSRSQPAPKKSDPNQYLFFVLKTDLKTIRSRIKKRVEKRLNQGLLGEIYTLTKKYSWSDPGLNTLSYKEFKPYFEGQIDLKSCVKTWTQNEIHYAKRQITWFKKQKDIIPITSSKKDLLSIIEKMLQSF